MRCDRGCDRCCGFVTCTVTEFDRIMAFARANDVQPLRQGATCPFFQDGRCAVHSARPFTCRLFGHIDDPALTCPHGYNVNIPTPAHRELETRYEQLRNAEGTRHVHEAAYSATEVAELMMAEVNPATTPRDE